MLRCDARLIFRSVNGANHPNEARILSILDHEDAICLHGNVTIGGELIIDGEVVVGGALFLTDDDAAASVHGNSATVGGATGEDAILENVRRVPEPEFPEVDTTPFAALATGDHLDESSDYDQPVYNNIYIEAGADPEFGDGVVINGIVYIEAPNKVTFKGDCTINGLIVTEAGGDFDDCQLVFKSRVNAPGVDALPDDDPQFAEIKQHGGTFLLAPGFGVEFQGNASVVSGSIAADRIELKGNSDLTIKGFILGLTERELKLNGNTSITIDTSDIDSTPAGLLLPLKLTPDPDTYVEH